MNERMPKHPGLRMMEDRAQKALKGNADPVLPKETDPMVRVKAKSPEGRSYHVSIPRSQFGSLMTARV